MSDDVIGCGDSGCGDSGCVFGRGEGTRYGGQHTNGGCRCLEDDRTGRQLSWETKKRLRDGIRALREKLGEARAEAVMLREARNAWMVHSEAERRKSEAEILRLQRAHAEWVKRADEEVDALRVETKRLTAERDEARAEVERLRGVLDAFQRLALPSCSDYTCDQDGVMGPCTEAPGKTCIECCPMHRCGGGS